MLVKLFTTLLLNASRSAIAQRCSVVRDDHYLVTFMFALSAHFYIRESDFNFS